MYWLAGIVYILQQNFSSFRGHSLEEIITNNFVLNTMFGQILLVTFISRICLVYNYVYSLYLWYTLPPLPPRPEPNNEDANNDANNNINVIGDVNGNFQ